MLVDHAPRRSLERGRQRTCGLGDVIVDERLQFGGLVVRDERADKKKQLRLAVVEVPHELHEQTDVSLLLTDSDGRRVFPGAGQPRAVGRTLDLDQAFCAATDGANLLSDGRTTSAGPADITQGANHSAIIVQTGGVFLPGTVSLDPSGPSLLDNSATRRPSPIADKFDRQLQNRFRRAGV